VRPHRVRALDDPNEIAVTESSSERAYDDDSVRLAVQVTDTGAIRVEALGLGVSAAVQLSVMGAQRLSGLLGAAITTAIHRGLGGSAR
jgi:hypothetical protein